MHIDTKKFKQRELKLVEPSSESTDRHSDFVEIDIEIMVEVHNQNELEQALQLNTDLIGVNNRNLHSFETSLQTTLDLAAQVPADKVLITESGIHTRGDVNIMTDAGIYGFLIGESFMRAPSPGAKLKELMFGK